jgi:signal transduction histidine kinase
MTSGHPVPATMLWVEVGLLALALVLALPDPGAVWVGFVGLPILVYGWLGARIASRVPRNPVGWLLSGAAATAAIGVAGTAYHAFGRALPLADAVHVLVVACSLPAIGVCLLLAFLSFPEGRLPSPRWRPVTWLIATTGAAASIAMLGDNELVARGLSPAWARTGVFGSPFPDIVAIAAGTAFLATAASLAVRARRASREERRPIRGLLVSLLLMAAMLPIIAVFANDDDSWLIVFPAFAVLALGVLVLIPFSLSIAMLRWGLFDYEIGIRKTIARTLLTLVIFLVAVPVVFLIGSTSLGLFMAGGGGPSSAMGPALATALGGAFGVGLTLVVIWGRRFADRVVFRERATPYEVLSQFSGRVGETYSLEDVLPRMSLILANGTGASVVRIWLSVNGTLRPVAAHPDDAPAAEPILRTGDELETDDPSRRAFAVRHRGELLGAIDITMPANDPMNAQKERLVRDLAAQAALVLRNVGLLEDVRESRRRIVAAQDERARRLERDIHDGAQQQLVALTVKLRLAEQLTRTDPEEAGEALRGLQLDATAALEDLRDLARGIYPPLLADRGLAEALASQGRKSAVAVDVDADGIGRYPEEVESAVYFSCLEALQNVAKYAEATHATVRLTQGDGILSFDVTDDGRGFDQQTRTRGSGLQGIADRLAALGGTLEVRSARGEGTTVSGRLPVEGAR